VTVKNFYFPKYIQRRGKERGRGEGGRGRGEGEGQRSEIRGGKENGRKENEELDKYSFPQFSFPIFYVSLLGNIAQGTVGGYRVRF